MILPAWEPLTRDETAARDFLLEYCWPQGRRCPRCGGEKLYAQADGRWRCAACDDRFRDFSGRWIGSCGLSPARWLAVLGNFVREVPAAAIARETGLSYNAVHRACTAIRLAITAHAADADCLFGPGDGFRLAPRKRGRMHGPSGPRPVFGILSDDSGVSTRIIPELADEVVCHLGLRATRRESVTATEPYRDYLALVFACKPHRHCPANRCGQGELPLEQDDFWAYAQDRLEKLCGVSRRLFPLYLKELEFRYNRRGEAVSQTLLAYLCAFTPDRTQAPLC